MDDLDNLFFNQFEDVHTKVLGEDSDTNWNERYVIPDVPNLKTTSLQLSQAFTPTRMVSKNCENLNSHNSKNQVKCNQFSDNIPLTQLMFGDGHSPLNKSARESGPITTQKKRDAFPLTQVHPSTSQAVGAYRKPMQTNKVGIVTPSHLQKGQAETSSQGLKSNCQSSQIFEHPNQNIDDSQTDIFNDTYIAQTPHTLRLPAVTPDGSTNGTLLVKAVALLPDIYQKIFPFPYFNVVQSKVFDDVVYGDLPIVMCAPTGSGKTAIFELAIIRLIIKHTGELPTSSKIVYMAPMKALCSERFEDWETKFRHLGLKCKELTGDTELEDFIELQDIHIILTTPEKWDSMTRIWRENQSLVQLVRLFLIDEVHLLNDTARGATLEAVVSRMKTLHTASITSHKSNDNSHALSNSNRKIRFLAISATIPNVEDVAEWLSMKGTKTVFHKMADSYRPVRLRKVVLGFPLRENNSLFLFDLSLNYKLASVIDTYSDQKPTLVFCSTRKGVQQAATTLVKEARFIIRPEQKLRLQNIANTLRDSKLRDLVLHGVGFHHAGMDMQDRKSIESLFMQGDLHVLMATSTLAMGVNLPAHLVIVKSTMHYVMGNYKEYSESQVLQMIGRAGRPQFDTTATAVIMTKTDTKHKYEALLNGTQVVESSLHENLVEHLNAEIVLGTITDVSVAVEWLKSTFLYIRVLKNPKYYGLPVGLTTNQMEIQLQELCLKSINALAGASLVNMGNDGFVLQPTELGRQMARYCVAFDTMKHLQTVDGTETLSDLLTLLCVSKEFHDIQLRNNEKKILNSLNKDKNKPTIRFPLQGKIKTKEMKTNVLIQAQMGCLSIQDFGLSQDVNKINRSAIRISKCLVEVLWQGNSFKSLLNAVLLAKCIKVKLWENSKFLSRQLPGIGSILANALVNAGIITFQMIEEKHPRDLELILNRHPPFGNQVKEAVTKLPKYELCIDQSCNYSNDNAELTLTISIANADKIDDKSNNMCILLVGDADNKVIIKSKISDSHLLRHGLWTKRLEVKRANHGPELSINFISQETVGLDIQSNYTPFYRGPKRVSRVPMPTSRINQSKPTGSTLNIYDETYMDHTRRQCGHHCINKASCAHNCCKYGVTLNIHVPKMSAVDKYRLQMKERLVDFPSTPRIKRVKMGDSKGSMVNLQKFSYTADGTNRQYLPHIPSAVQKCTVLVNPTRSHSTVDHITDPVISRNPIKSKATLSVTYPMEGQDVNSYDLPGELLENDFNVCGAEKDKNNPWEYPENSVAYHALDDFRISELSDGDETLINGDLDLIPIESAYPAENESVIEQRKLQSTQFNTINTGLRCLESHFQQHVNKRCSNKKNEIIENISLDDVRLQVKEQEICPEYSDETWGSFDGDLVSAISCEGQTSLSSQTGNVTSPINHNLMDKEFSPTNTATETSEQQHCMVANNSKFYNTFTKENADFYLGNLSDLESDTASDSGSIGNSINIMDEQYKETSIPTSPLIEALVPQSYKKDNKNSQCRNKGLESKFFTRKQINTNENNISDAEEIHEDIFAGIF